MLGDIGWPELSPCGFSSGIIPQMKYIRSLPSYYWPTKTNNLTGSGCYSTSNEPERDGQICENAATMALTLFSKRNKLIYLKFSFNVFKIYDTTIICFKTDQLLLPQPVVYNIRSLTATSLARGESKSIIKIFSAVWRYTNNLKTTKSQYNELK